MKTVGTETASYVVVADFLVAVRAEMGSVLAIFVAAGDPGAKGSEKNREEIGPSPAVDPDFMADNGRACFFAEGAVNHHSVWLIIRMGQTIPSYDDFLDLSLDDDLLRHLIHGYSLCDWS
jgi:hypothetical protein